jgi:hypothetical protein
MSRKVWIAVISAGLLTTAHEAQAQNNKPVSSAPVPVQITLPITAFTQTGETVSSVFAQDVPAGKRLIVQHLSVSFVIQNVTEELAFASCEITGTSLDVNGTEQGAKHIIPLTSRLDAAGGVEGFSAGQEMTWYVEPGPIRLICRAGFQGLVSSGLQGNISGTLIPK